MKAYMVHEGDPQDGCTLVWANSASQAKATAQHSGWYDEYISMRAVRKPDFDKYAGDGNEPWFAETNDDLPEGVSFFYPPDTGYDTAF